MLSLTPTQRDELLRTYRKNPDPELRFRAHILLLLGDGLAWDTIEAVLFCSSRTVDRWLKRFQAEGVGGLTGKKRGRPFRLGLGWVAVLVTWVTTKTPGDFGFLRSRWSCVLLALLLREREGVTAGRETVRRWLRDGEMVYRRPRPVPPPNEEQRRTRLAALRAVLENLPADETVVWQDEVEVHTNPKIGRMWMPKGQQATVSTPGTNKRNSTSPGRSTGGPVRCSSPRRRRSRVGTGRCSSSTSTTCGVGCGGTKTVHVICDNAGFHTSHEVIESLGKHEGRIEVHLLPNYSPDDNPIERVWWHLHEDITRNHRCKDLGE